MEIEGLDIDEEAKKKLLETFDEVYSEMKRGKKVFVKVVKLNE